MEQSKKVPVLRFPEFSGEWESKTLGGIGKFMGGGTPSKSIADYWQGNIPWISSSDITEDDIHKIKITRFINENSIKESATKIIPKESILFVSRVGVGKLAINKEEVCTSQDFTNFIPKTADSYYLGYFFIAKKNILISFNQGTSIKGFTKSDIENLNLSFPSKPEQTKIADFLTQIDNKINQLSQKKQLLERYKKGVMQQIFSQSIRFTDDDGREFPEWEEKSLGEIADRVTRKNKENNKNVITISAQQGLINQEKFFNKSVSAKDITGYYLLHNGDFAYNKSYSSGYPMGAIKCLNNYEKGVVSTLYICFKFKENNINNFFEQYFASGLQNKEIEKVAQEGARNHGLLNIGINDFFSIYLNVPCLEEQTKIANFLTALDTKIALVESQLNGTKQYKKGLLQQLFV